MPDPNVVSPDEYTLVRGVPVQTAWIKNVEQRLEAKLILNSELPLLKNLDRELGNFRFQARIKGKSYHPVDRRFTTPTNFYYYEELPIPVGIYLPGLPTIQTHDIPTPAWFRARRNLAMKSGGLTRLKGIS